MSLIVKGDYFHNRIYRLIFVMGKCRVFFEVRIESLNIIQNNLCFWGFGYYSDDVFSKTF
jgi:hypothetical protein